MKKQITLLLFLTTIVLSNNYIAAHCGSCSVGDKTKAHGHNENATHRLDVSGMTCHKCSKKIAAKLKKYEDISILHIDSKTGTIYIKSNHKKVSKWKLRRLISKAGYKLKKISIITQEKS